MEVRAQEGNFPLGGRSTIPRRGFLGGAVFAGAALLMPPWLKSLAAEPAGERPNFVFLFAEDITPDFGCYGDRLAVTPTIDQLAKQSVTYRHCNSTAPVCSPSRSAVGSGMYQTTYDAQDHRSGGKSGADAIYFTRFLRDAGYWVGYYGKTDANKVSLEDAFDVQTRADLAAAGWKNPARRERPFFFFRNVFLTHEARTWRGRQQYSDDYMPADRRQPTPVEIPLPPYHADTPTTRQEWVHYYSNMTAFDEIVAQTLADLERDGLRDSTIVIVASDHGHGLARGKRTPYTSGVRVPMIVHVPPRFRRPGMPEVGSMSDQLVSLLDLAPTVLDLAGAPVPAHMHGQPMFANSERRQYLFASVDRNDNVYDRRRTLFDGGFRYIRNFLPHMPRTFTTSYDMAGATFRDLVKGHHAKTLPPEGEALFEMPRAMEELYDTQIDPHEVKNLADKPEHRERLLAFRRDLKDFVMGRTKHTHGKIDLGLFSAGDTPEGMEQLWSWMAWANSAAFAAQPADPDAKAPNLDSKDTVEQRWAAIGLAYALQLSEEQVRQLEALIAPTYTDRQVAQLGVQTYAAWALARQKAGDVELAIRRLVDIKDREWAGTRGASGPAAIFLGYLRPELAKKAPETGAGED